MGASAAKMMNDSTEQKRCAPVSCWAGFLEMLKSGFLEKIGVWEQLILRLKRRKILQTKRQNLDHVHTQAAKQDVKCCSTFCRA